MMKLAFTRIHALLIVLVMIGLTAAFFGSAIQRELLVALLLRKPSPSPDVVRELFDAQPDPAELLTRFWNSGQIPHRIMALDYLRFRLPSQKDLLARVAPLIAAATLDADASARELAFGLVAMHKPADLARLALALVRDPDPELRLLGLRYVRQSKQTLVADIATLLDDPDYRVAGTAASLLRTWTEQDFGVRLHMTVPDAITEKINPEKLERLTSALHQWRQWWAANQEKFPASTAESAPAALVSRVRAANFSLPDLSGRTVQLRDFRGKKVLLNFWATWCTACLVEIPSLVELQESRTGELIILGISLDGRPDPHDHGHDHGSHRSEAHDESEGHGHDHHDHHGHDARSKSKLDEIREKVLKVVKSKGINYPVLLNPDGDIGARFNGHELPANVLIDSSGYVRRRFIGKRDLTTLNAMLREIQ